MHEWHSVCHRMFLFRVFFVGSFINLGVTILIDVTAAIRLNAVSPFFLGIITNKGHWNGIRSFMPLSSNQLNKGSLLLQLTMYIFLYFLPRLNSLLDIIVSMSVLVGYSITTASFVLYVVKEHQTKAKQLQHISGIGMTSYWVTNFVYDLVNNSNS